jgi:hypothetical protein
MQNHNLPEFFESTSKRLISNFEKASTGYIFDKKIQNSVINSLHKLQSSNKSEPELKLGLIEAMNALALDIQIRTFLRQGRVSANGGNPTLKKIEWMTYARDTKPGTLSINVRNGLPASAEGYEPSWPLATYHLEYNGNASGENPLYIHFRINDYTFAREGSSFHILQWDGKTYNDITDNFDPLKRQVTGKITGSCDIVLMEMPIVK